MENPIWIYGYKDYTTFMEDIVSKGYARKVLPDHNGLEKGRAWHIPHQEYIIPTNREKFGSYLTAQPNSWVSPSTTCYTRAQTRLTLWWEFFQDFAKTG